MKNYNIDWRKVMVIETLKAKLKELEQINEIRMNSYKADEIVIIAIKQSLAELEKKDAV